MKKFKEKLKNIFKNKIFISILLLTLCIFPLLSGLNGSKTGEIKANAYTEPPTVKKLNLNGITYNYQTSLNELKNNYGFFRKWYDTLIFRITNNTEGETQILLSGQSDDQILSSEQIELTSSILSQSIAFYKRELNSGEITKLNSFASNNTIDGNNETNNLVFDFEDIDDFHRLKNFSVNFALLKQIPYFNSEVDDLTFNSFTMNFVYVNNNVNPNNLENIDYMDKNVKFFSYCFSNQVDFYNFELPIMEDFTIRNIYLTFETEDTSNQFDITQAVPSEYIFLNKQSWEDYKIVIDNITFINNSQSNIISYNFNFKRNDNFLAFPAFQGNILLSTTKYDAGIFSTINNTLQTIQQPIGRGYFGGYNEEKNAVANIYFEPIAQPGLSGVGVYLNGSYGPFDYRFYSLFWGFINPLDGDSVWKYNNQNQLLYLQDLTDLRINSSIYTGEGLSAQVDNILYNVTLVGNEQQIQKNENIQEDFINLLKTSALGTFIGLLIGIISGNPALGAVIGGVSGIFASILPLAIDAVEGLLGSSPALTTIYNLFKSITMLFVDIFDAIINFALKFITNPIVLILVVVGILVYIFVIRKFKK